MPHNVASVQGLQCLLTGFFHKNRIKVIKETLYPPKMTNGLIEYITVEESTSTEWVQVSDIHTSKVRVVCNLCLYTA